MSHQGSPTSYKPQSKLNDITCGLFCYLLSLQFPPYKMTSLNWSRPRKQINKHVVICAIVTQCQSLSTSHRKKPVSSSLSMKPRSRVTYAHCSAPSPCHASWKPPPQEQPYCSRGQAGLLVYLEAASGWEQREDEGRPLRVGKKSGSPSSAGPHGSWNVPTLERGLST